jgi:SAM-dependent methyltransferase
VVSLPRTGYKVEAMFDLAANYYLFEDVNHAVVDILGRQPHDLPTAPALLDIGCGRGQLGAALRQLGYRVTGIESHPEALCGARERLDEVLPIDLGDERGVAAALGDRRYDVILFACVLEHLRDPLAALRFYLGFLSPHGRIVVSVPNIASWDRRLALLFGHFDYADAGTMDRTHLRFFTFRTARTLLGEAGLVTLSVSYEPGIVRAFLPLIKGFYAKPPAGAAPDPGEILQSRAYRLYERWLLPAETLVAGLWRGMLAFRIVLVAAARYVRSSALRGCPWQSNMRPAAAASYSPRYARGRG